ncbi:hypothetical protein [Streptomyces sp. B93]|uniref:hypothetical protein n=1 Tax=Streptomyces sp. B93 TaxID=2824875 RepID=UPI001B38A79D|nr:hypothetical protein [Streptomyces sp. B93]MBQ1088526.1 hypothetical protein [Streptomyces sp. B93]
MTAQKSTSGLPQPLRGAVSVLGRVPGAGLVGRVAEETLNTVGSVSPRRRRLAVYTGAGVLGVAGVVEWPVAVAGAAVAWLTQPKPRPEDAEGDEFGEGGEGGEFGAGQARAERAEASAEPAASTEPAASAGPTAFSGPTALSGPAAPTEPAADERDMPATGDERPGAPADQERPAAPADRAPADASPGSRPVPKPSEVAASVHGPASTGRAATPSTPSAKLDSAKRPPDEARASGARHGVGTGS